MCVFGIDDINNNLLPYPHFLLAKNDLRIFRGSKPQKIMNIEAQQKIKYSYKKNVM